MLSTFEQFPKEVTVKFYTGFMIRLLVVELLHYTAIKNSIENYKIEHHSSGYE